LHFWTEEEDKFLCEKYEVLEVAEISKLLGKSESSIRNHAHKLNLYKGYKKYKHNEKFFLNYNEKNCYWAGLLAADGWIRIIKNTSYLFLLLKQDDKSHITQFANDICFTGPVKDRVSKYKGKDYLSSIIEVCACSELVNDLKCKFNIVPKKSLILNPPFMTDINHKLAFICGYIDGDGCIREDEKGRLELSMVGTQDMLLWIQQIFDEIVPPQGKYLAKARKRKKNRNYSDYKITGYRAVFILKKILEIETPKLERKWAIAQKFVEQTLNKNHEKKNVKTWVDGFQEIEKISLD